jgi:hypothetical protein
MKISDFGYNRYSQFGEDGIIEKIFSIIQPTTKICIEFGAWDGLFYSNTANLWKNGWKGILIEANKDKYYDLVKNTREYDCICFNKYILPLGEDSIESLLVNNRLNYSIDFLSIDIDGGDYHILKNLSWLRPRVISCEYNPTIPKNIEFIPPISNYFGCSAKSLCNLAESMEYKLISLTDTNCFFVRNEEFEKFNEYVTFLEDLSVNKYLTYLISGYDGSFVLSQEPVYGFGEISNLNFQGNYYRPKKKSNNLLKSCWLYRKLFRK